MCPSVCCSDGEDSVLQNRSCWPVMCPRTNTLISVWITDQNRVILHQIPVRCKHWHSCQICCCTLLLIEFQSLHYQRVSHPADAPKSPFKHNPGSKVRREEDCSTDQTQQSWLYRIYLHLHTAPRTWGNQTDRMENNWLKLSLGQV